MAYSQDLNKYLTAEVRNEIRRIWAFDTCGERGRRDSLIRSLTKGTKFIGLKRSDIEDLFGKPDNSTRDDGQLYYSYVLLGTIDVQTHKCKCGPMFTASTLNVRMSVENDLVNYFKIEEE